MSNKIMNIVMILIIIIEIVIFLIGFIIYKNKLSKINNIEMYCKSLAEKTFVNTTGQYVNAIGCDIIEKTKKNDYTNGVVKVDIFYNQNGEVCEKDYLIYIVYKFIGNKLEVESLIIDDVQLK